MKQIRALRANGIVMLVSSVITAVCVGVCWKHFPIAVQAIYICISLMFAVFGGGEYVNGVWQPSKEGLGMGHVFDELNKIYGDGFIKY